MISSVKEGSSDHTSTSCYGCGQAQPIINGGNKFTTEQPACKELTAQSHKTKLPHASQMLQMCMCKCLWMCILHTMLSLLSTGTKTMGTG